MTHNRGKMMDKAEIIFLQQTEGPGLFVKIVVVCGWISLLLVVVDVVLSEQILEQNGERGAMFSIGKYLLLNVRSCNR